MNENDTNIEYYNKDDNPDHEQLLLEYKQLIESLGYAHYDD